MRNGWLLVLTVTLIVGPGACSRKVPVSPRRGVADPQAPASGLVDLSVITRQPERYQNRSVHVRGIVASVCQQEGCFIDIVPTTGEGEGVLVSGRDGPGGYPRDSVGRLVEAKGTFFSKVYPRSRMQHWQHHSWRAREAELPEFARINRIAADSVVFSRSRSSVPIRETPLSAYRSRVIPLDRMEFEAARMGTGKKCLAPGKSTAARSTRRYHELLFAVSGALTVRMQGLCSPLTIGPGEACYISPRTRYTVENRSRGTSCFVFVYSLPEKSSPHQHIEHIEAPSGTPKR